MSTSSLIASDRQGNVLRVNELRLGYTPFGFCAAARQGRPGYCGELVERFGLQQRGQGYRWYAPERGYFVSYDSLSPHGKGGINGYLYCGGDGVNRVDPDGHFAQILSALMEPVVLAVRTQLPKVLIKPAAQLARSAGGRAFARMLQIPDLAGSAFSVGYSLRSMATQEDPFGMGGFWGMSGGNILADMVGQLGVVTQSISRSMPLNTLAMQPPRASVNHSMSSDTSPPEPPQKALEMRQG